MTHFRSREAAKESVMLMQLKSLIRSFDVPTVAQLELAYLNRCRDRADLEYRQRQIELGLFRQGCMA